MSARVLIVDDSLTVRMDLQEAFEAAGFDAQSCGTVKAAIEVLDGTVMDVIVLDLRLPDGDGLTVLEHLRAQESHAQAVVLVLSSESEVKDRVRGMRTGADDYVGKPYDTHHVLARTRELLRARKAQYGAASNQQTILVVDDSVTFRETLREAFEHAGYAVQLASSGEEGLRMAVMNRPSALVVDSVMPGIDGATVIRRMRLDVSLRDMPCLLMTASDEIGAELRALDAGADSFVRKDEPTELVVAKLAAVLRSAAASAQDETSSPVSGVHSAKRILAVDDSVTFLEELSATLREEGYDVVQARSGEEALDLLSVQSVDCILLDLMMPGIGGQETSRRIKAAPAVREIPLIMLTSLDNREAMLEGLSAGADDYLQKSSEFDVLKARVRAQIRRKQFEDENRRIRLELLKAELEASEARAARALADSRAELLAVLAQKNQDLEAANSALQARQDEIDKAYRALAEANEAKSEFLSTMSHELRTPLNAIIGFSYIMLDGVSGALAPKQREFINHIHDGGQHLLSLVNEILDLAKIEAGRADMELESIHIDSLLGDAMSVVQPKAEAQRITLRCHGLGTDETFQADKRRLKQILYNLLSNAVKFTPDDGEVLIQARLVDRQEATEGIPGFARGVRMALPDSGYQTFLELSVTDSGIGIAHADMGQLFKPFAQIKNAHTRNIEGTGLGLATVMRLAQLHGGTVALSSQPRAGSCFTIWLPWRQERSTAMHDVDANSDEMDADRSLPCALVIEDDAEAAALMRAQLQTAGFNMRHASSAEQALRMVSIFTPDLIALDIHLPGMDGWEFIARIKESSAWANVPIVVVSVDANHEIGLSLGARAVLQKPFGPGELRQELERLGFHPPPGGQLKILIVDDDPRALELMSVYLRQPGYAIFTAYGGQEGIAMVQTHLPDLVVLDLLMPDIGGIEVVEALKQDPATAGIPVIIATAKQFTDADRAQLSNHVLSVVNKSELHHDRFLGEVRRAFSKPPVSA